MKKLVILALLLFPALASAQIPSGYVQATATVPVLANGSFGAAWTNLSSSPQLGLLGCVSTFQTTVNGTIDSFGKFSVLLADPGQICPSPSTWTFTFSCYKPPGAFITPITVTGGGSADDISAQILAAAPANICTGGGGGPGVTSVSCDPAMGNILGCNVTNPGTTPGLHWTLNSQSGQSIYGNFNGSTGAPFFANYTCTGLLTCGFNSGSNTLNFNVPASAALSITATSPIRVNAGTGPVSSGTANIDCPTCGSALIQPVVTPPVTGQYVVIRPTTYAQTRLVGGASQSGIANGIVAGALLFTGDLCALDNEVQVQFGGFALPAGITAGQVTAIYLYSTNGTSTLGTGRVCFGTPAPNIPAAVSIATGPYNVTTTPLSTSTQHTVLTTFTGTDIPGVVVTADSVISTQTDLYTYFGISDVGMIVYYTGSPVVQPSGFYIGPYLSWNPATNTLGTDPNFPKTLFEYKVATLPGPQAFPQSIQWVSDGVNATDCTVGGGNNVVACVPVLSGTNYIWQAWGSGGGGSGTVTSVGTNSSLIGGPITTVGTLGLNLSNANTWTAAQTFNLGLTIASGYSLTNTGVSDGCGTWASGVLGSTGSPCGSGGGGGVTGSGTTGYLPKWTGSTALGNSAIDDGITTASTVTSTEPIAIAAASLATQQTFTYNSGHAPSGSAGSAVVAPDTSGNFDVSENNGSFARVCTATNGICATGTGTVTDSSGTTTANQFALSTTTTHQIQYSTAIPNGTTATTQTPGDNTTKVATDAFVLANAGSSVWSSLTNPTGNLSLNLGTNLTTFTGGLNFAGPFEQQNTWTVGTINTSSIFQNFRVPYGWTAGTVFPSIGNEFSMAVPSGGTSQFEADAVGIYQTCGNVSTDCVALSTTAVRGVTNANPFGANFNVWDNNLAGPNLFALELDAVAQNAGTSGELLRMDPWIGSLANPFYGIHLFRDTHGQVGLTTLIESDNLASVNFADIGESSTVSGTSQRTNWGNGSTSYAEFVDAGGLLNFNGGLKIGSSGQLTVAKATGYLTLSGCAGGSFLAADGTGCATPSGSGTVNSGSGYALPAYASGSGTAVSPSNVKTDATGNVLLAPGIVDGLAPVTVTTGSSATLGGTYKSGYTFNQNATAATAIAYTLPTAAAGLQYCVGNSWNGSAATTGTLELLTSASGQFIIFTDGTLSATGGYVISAGAAADFACVVGVDSTHWFFKPSSGTWSKH